ncbi:hypothetical protein [Actinacidiphila glaucinigra]|uniref:hypothetical protein n=1 Tax=Actinacidiphila glaucinigra TaxID=235986 RepID=UPI0029B88F6B|nr:hypothetical protein [Streptomyces sp. PA03-3a]
MSHPDPGVQRVQLHKDAIETARSVGVGTVIYSSMMLGGETGLDSLIGIQQGHIHIMRHLAQSGIDHIIVRQGIYAEGWPHYVGSAARAIRAGDPRPLEWTVPQDLEWTVPQDIAIAWTGLDELGEGNATILAHYRDYLGQTLRLTGPRATKISKIAKEVEERTGRSVKLQFAGWHPFCQGLANGEGEIVDPLLGQLLGHPAKGIEEMPDELFVQR